MLLENTATLPLANRCIDIQTAQKQFVFLVIEVEMFEMLNLTYLTYLKKQKEEAPRFSGVGARQGHVMTLIAFIVIAERTVRLHHMKNELI